MTKFIHFDREDFINQAAGSEDIAKQVVELYHRDVAKDLLEIETAFEAGNLEAIRRLAHKSKSGFIIMGATPLHKLALQLETKAKHGDSDLKADLATFRVQCEGLEKELCSEFGVG